MSSYLFPYKWNLKDGYPAKGIEHHKLKVFGTFICGGGSTMGYKLAGFNYIGGVEIDPKIADVYKTNHNPKHFYVEDLRVFNKRKDLPDELYNLDILDGSPPCSSFSMAGNREKDWGKNKQFREGQAKQVLDNLVYVYINTIKKLQPKVAILENVKGLIQGNAKVYAKKMKKQFEDAGYNIQVFLLNAASMGVPQRRERVFFIGLRKDFKVPKLDLRFNEISITFGDIENKTNNIYGEKLTPAFHKWWKVTPCGKSFSFNHPKGSFFNSYKVSKTLPLPTITATGGAAITHHTKPNKIAKKYLCMGGTYPLDFNFKEIEPKYLIGMSVPPVMTAQIANQVYNQWLTKIYLDKNKSN